MANLRDWYYGQIVSQAQMDEAFDWLEDADHSISEDHGLTGVVSGLVVGPTAPASMSVALTGPGLAYDKDGNRAYIAAASPTVDCSVDEFGVSTAVAGGANEKYLGVFVRFKRRLTDAEIDGAGLQVYTRRWEDAEVFVRQGAEAAIGGAARVALLADAILLADVRLVFGTTAILAGGITVTRREDFSRVVTTNYGTKVYGTAKDAIAGLWAAVDSAASGSGPFTFSQTWFGGVAVGGTATVAGALNEIVKDLAAATGGAAYVAAANFASTYVSWTATSIQGALSALGTAINGHISGSAPQHPATSITFTPYSYLASATVQAAIQELITDLASTAAGTSGASRIGAQTNAGMVRTLTGGTLHSQLDYLLNQLDGINILDQLILGEWGFRGRVSADNLESSNWSMRMAQYPSVPINRTFTSSRPNAHHPSLNSISLGVADIVDVVAIVGDDAAEQLTYAVAVGKLGSFLFWFDPGKMENGDVQIAITGLTAGVSEVTAACSDGISVFMLVKRNAGNDTVACVNPVTGVVVWEQNLFNATALAGFPYDRIIVGTEIIDNSPWVVPLIILNGNIDADVTGCVQMKRSDTGASYSWGNSDGGGGVTGRKPAGGLAVLQLGYGTGGVIAFTTMTAGGTLIAKLARLGEDTGTPAAAINMASGGTSVNDEAYDLVSDGSAFHWVSRAGYYRFHQIAHPDSWWGETSNVGSSFPLIGNGWPICFDGQRLWMPCFDATDHRVRLMRKEAFNQDLDQPWTNHPSKGMMITNAIGTGWTPYEADWQMGRMACIGPHVVWCMRRPSSATRNFMWVVYNVHSRHG